MKQTKQNCWSSLSPIGTTYSLAIVIIIDIVVKYFMSAFYFVGQKNEKKIVSTERVESSEMHMRSFADFLCKNGSGLKHWVDKCQMTNETGTCEAI